MFYPHLHKEPLILTRPLPHHGVSAEIKERSRESCSHQQVGPPGAPGPPPWHRPGHRASRAQASSGPRPEAEAREPGLGSGTASGRQGAATSTEGQTCLVLGALVRVPGQRRMSKRLRGPSALSNPGLLTRHGGQRWRCLDHGAAWGANNSAHRKHVHRASVQ